MGGNKFDRKMSSGSATVHQVRDGDKGLKQTLLQTESAVKNNYTQNLSTQYLSLPGIK
jgi:hypothetical protein